MIVGGLFLLLVVLGLLALPFRKAPAAADSAKADLEAAKAALTAKDFDAAEVHIASARRHADEVQDAMQGIGGDVWSLIPIVGRPVADVRHMGNALDELTSVAEAGVEAWPLVDGKKATLFEDGAVDVPTLTQGRGCGLRREHQPRHRPGGAVRGPRLGARHRHQGR